MFIIKKLIYINLKIEVIKKNTKNNKYNNGR